MSRSVFLTLLFGAFLMSAIDAYPIEGQQQNNENEDSSVS